MVRYYALRAKLVQFVKARPPLYRFAVRTRPLRRFLSYPIKAVLGPVRITRFLLAVGIGRSKAVMGSAWITRFLLALGTGRSKAVMISAWIMQFLPTLGTARRPASRFDPSGLPPQIIMLVISEVWRDPRVEREARSLARGGFRVKVVYPDFFSTEPGVPSMNWGKGIEFRPLPGYYHSFIHTFPYLLGSDFLEALRDERPFAYHAHDLTTALIGLAAAKTTNAHCVCDFHEWYSENVSWDARRSCYIPHPWVKKLIYQLAELVVMHRASAIVTVCDSIANDLNSGRYLTRRKIEVIRNIPPLKRAGEIGRCDLRKEIAIADERFIVLWQGGVGPTRMIEPLIEAFKHIPRGVLVIRGPAIERYGADYLALARTCGAEGRVFCLPSVPSTDVVAAATSAGAGIWSLPHLCKNFYYALPNKIFEYLAAGLPILGADFPEVRRIVQRYEVGLCFDPYDPKSVAKQVNRMIDDPELVKRFRANVPAALTDMRADREWERLVVLYRRLEAGQAA